MLSKHPPYNPVPYQGKLTVANLITDVTRLAGVQGDGAAYPDSSVGVWPAATNDEPYGRGITNKQSNGTGLTLAATTENPLFGAGHIRATATGNSASAAIRHPTADALAVSASTAYTVSAWFKKVSGSFSSTGVFFINWLDAGRAYLSTSTSVSVAGVGAYWTRYSISVTSHASAAYAAVYWLSLGASQTVTIDITGMQLETGSIATPYIETDGGTASRSAGSITAIPAGVLDETQMWVMARIRVDSTQTGSGRIFSFGDSSNERLEMIITSTTNRTSTFRQTGGAGATASAASGTIAVGDAATYIGGWDANFCYAANNGAALTSAANTSIPTLSATDAALGKQDFASYGYPGVSFKWLAIGLAAPTDALSALGYAWGNNDPLPHMFPASARLSFLAHFNGDGTFYRRSA